MDVRPCGWARVLVSVVMMDMRSISRKVNDTVGANSKDSNELEPSVGYCAAQQVLMAHLGSYHDTKGVARWVDLKKQT